jgi:acyl-CoA thioesterase FadM
MYLTHFKPENSEISVGGCVHRWVLAKWFEQAQDKYIRQLYECCAGMQLGLATVSLRLDYFQPCMAMTEVNVEISVADVREASITLGCRITQNSEFCAIGSSELEVRDLVRKRQLPLTARSRWQLENEILEFQRISVAVAG